VALDFPVPVREAGELGLRVGKERFDEHVELFAVHGEPRIVFADHDARPAALGHLLHHGGVRQRATEDPTLVGDRVETGRVVDPKPGSLGHEAGQPLRAVFEIDHHNLLQAVDAHASSATTAPAQPDDAEDEGRSRERQPHVASPEVRPTHAVAHEPKAPADGLRHSHVRK
jgi:hypothetical protein